MAGREAVDITLGDRTFTIRPLTLGQVQRVEEELKKPGDFGVARIIAIVSIGLSRDHKDAAQGILDIEATTNELAQAMATVFRQGGMTPAKSGEAPAAAGHAPIGEASEAA